MKKWSEVRARARLDEQQVAEHRRRPTLLLEIEARHRAKYHTDPVDVTDWLAERGYGMRTWRNGDWHAIDRVTTASRNYLFTHPDRLS